MWETAAMNGKEAGTGVLSGWSCFYPCLFPLTSPANFFLSEDSASAEAQCDSGVELAPEQIPCKEKGVGQAVWQTDD